MRNKFYLLSITALVFAMSFGLMNLAHAQNSTMIFQQGVNGYSGTQDVTISNQYIEWSDVGVTDLDGPVKSYYKAEIGKTPYEKRALLKFAYLGIPAGAQVVSAKLTLVVTDWESGYNGMPQTVLKGYYLKNSWNQSAEKLGWLYRDDPQLPWSAEGADGSGDLISGKSFTMSGFNKSGDQIRTINLDTAIVQSWINDPSSNQGMIIINDTGDNAGTAEIHSSEDSNPALRPKLEITYYMAEDPGVPAEQEIITDENQTNSAPAVNLTGPTAGTRYTAPANILISANAGDDSRVARVEFYAGNSKIGEDTAAPYQYTWNNVSMGTYTFYAKAIDEQGLSGNSDAVSVLVLAPAAETQPGNDVILTPEPEAETENFAPTITIKSPANDSEFQSPANITIEAAPFDLDGQITQVDFYRGTQKIGETKSAPYSFAWQNVGAGEYHISAVAHDDDGNMTGSEAVRIMVKASNQPPVVNITSPANDSEFQSPASIAIEAGASDSDGTISRVEFYRGTAKIGEDSSAPYSFAWQNVGAGEYHLSAVAVDNGGEMTGSSAVRVTVNPAATTQPPSSPPASPPTSGSLKVGVDMDMCDSLAITGPAIYVSPNGNDASAGTISSPLKTVYAAIQTADAGTAIVLRGGTYNETQELRIRVPNITITSYPGEWAVINRNTGASEDMGVYFYVGSNGGKLQCVEVSGGFYTVSTETQWDWGGTDRSGASNILLENVKLHDSYRDVVKIKPQSDDITIRHAEIYNSSNGEMDGECNAEGIDNVNGDRMHVSYSYIHDTCSTGVYFKGGATDGIIENNLIENTGAAGIIIGFDTSPEFFDLADNPNYYENIRGIARHNLIRNTGWAGIALYASKDAQVYNNTIINAASIHHSPIYYGITFQDWEPQAGRPANINPSIHHNIVSQPAERDAHMVGIRQSGELGGLSGLQGATGLDNNCYYQAGSAGTYQDGRTKLNLGDGWLTDWTGNFAEWQAHTNAEAGSHEVNPGLDSSYKPTNPLCSGMGY
ncbi:MAG: Ig-like domain-containing protein [Patescibacteria group bacterium]